jgi:hypothetical protein
MWHMLNKQRCVFARLVENGLLAAATEHAVASGLGRGEFGGYFNNLRALNQTLVPMSKSMCLRSPAWRVPLLMLLPLRVTDRAHSISLSTVGANTTQLLGGRTLRCQSGA